MSEGHCGNCDHYHHLKQGKVDCIVDSKLHDTGDSCDDYKTRIPSKSSTVRSEEGLEVRRSREAKAAEQRDREFAEREAEKDRQHAKELLQTRMKFDKRLWRATWWWQLILVVIGAGLGIFGTLIFKS
ncbi:MAG: hypothetical protein E3J56_15000 [Candidatus Aminicenantes bacterium]|nr:MAG: hypothetical protein E3J56_15000 [Candidatus Aminicenantes bacterium]